MTTQEGVIQFFLEHTPTGPLSLPSIPELSHWHARLHQAGLVGQDNMRYGGYAYGNMSARLHNSDFIISGTQTGGIPMLDASHYAVIDGYDIRHNQVRSHGPIEPSSECLSHAAVYAACPGARAVVHVHSAAIWHHAADLGLSRTPESARYGTPEMANAVTDMIRSMEDTSTGILCMGGHTDGVIAWGASVEQASECVLAMQVLAERLV